MPCSEGSQVPSWHHWARLRGHVGQHTSGWVPGSHQQWLEGEGAAHSSTGGGHFPEKSPDGTWPTWGEERKLLPCWGGGQLRGRGPCVLTSPSCPHPIPTQAPWGGRAAAVGWMAAGQSGHRATEKQRNRGCPGPSPSPATPPNQGTGHLQAASSRTLGPGHRDVPGSGGTPESDFLKLPTGGWPNSPLLPPALGARWTPYSYHLLTEGDTEPVPLAGPPQGPDLQEEFQKETELG